MANVVCDFFEGAVSVEVKQEVVGGKLRDCTVVTDAEGVRYYFRNPKRLINGRPAPKRREDC